MIKRLFLLVFPSIAFAFSSIDHISEVEDVWSHLDERSMVVFDVDGVLITTEDQFQHSYAEKTFFSIVAKKILFASSKEERQEIKDSVSLSFILPKKVLIEDSFPFLIQSLQKRNVKTIALTNHPVGRFGLIESLEENRIQNLKLLGIDFGFSFPGLEKLLFNIDSSNAIFPLFQKGILFTKGVLKGKVLSAFFKEIDFYPDELVFLDDRIENIQSVEEEMQRLGIYCRAYLYRGGDRFFKDHEDKKLMEFQIQHLIETKHWLSDEEAFEMINTN